MNNVEIVDLNKLEGSPSQRYGHSSVVVGDFLYMFGGCSLDGKTFHKELVILNLQTMKWEEPIIEAGEGIDGRHFHSCEATSNDPKEAKLIFFGGKSNGYKNDVFAYDISKKKFEAYEHRYKNEKNKSSCLNKDLHPPTARYGHSSCYFQNRIFIFGGYDKNAFSKNDLYCFNFKTNMWKRFVIAKIPRRYHHSGVRLGSNYFILGGITSSLTPLNDFHRFDLSKLSFSTENNEEEEEEEEEGKELDDCCDDHDIEAFELTVQNPIASYGHKCFVWEGKIYQFGGRNEEKEFRHLLQLDDTKGYLRWVSIGGGNDDDDDDDDDRLFMNSYGSLNIYKNKLLFFGGQEKKQAKLPISDKKVKKKKKQKKKKKKQKKKEEEVEGEEEDDDIIISDKLPFDTIFKTFEFLTDEEILNLCIVSKYWSISQAARSDRIWLKKYEEEVSIINIPSYAMKKVKRRKTSFEKYKMLKHQETLNKIRIRKASKMRDIDNIKVNVVGDGAVGKTCLLIVYASEDHRFPTEYVPTIFDNFNTTITINEKDIGLGLWDTGGEEDYAELRPLSYIGSHCFLICVSCANPVSLANVKSLWVPEIRKHQSDTPYIIVLTKTDLRSDEGIARELRDENMDFVTYEEAIKMAKDVKAAGVVECSSYTGDGVKEVFEQAINEALFGGFKHNKDKCGIM